MKPVVLRFEGFHLILGMDWMSKNHVVLDTQSRVIRLACPGRAEIINQCSSQNENVFSSFLFSIAPSELKIEDIEVVQDFPNVFQEIPGLPP